MARGPGGLSVGIIYPREAGLPVTDRIRVLSNRVLEEYGAKFGGDFAANKAALKEVATIRSKMLRNEIAGRITKIIRAREAEAERAAEAEREQAAQKAAEEAAELERAEGILSAKGGPDAARRAEAARKVKIIAELEKQGAVSEDEALVETEEAEIADAAMGEASKEEEEEAVAAEAEAAVKREEEAVAAAEAEAAVKREEEAVAAAEAEAAVKREEEAVAAAEGGGQSGKGGAS